eukprot:GHVU01095046.1.p1 GENE.GHVU01095046.1~~GHVU01095046.1.p1  ORF type:complete len:180 (-),score=10.08 GHVU01095046.1:103-642(-)
MAFDRVCPSTCYFCPLAAGNRCLLSLLSVETGKIKVGFVSTLTEAGTEASPKADTVDLVYPVPIWKTLFKDMAERRLQDDALYPPVYYYLNDSDNRAWSPVEAVEDGPVDSLCDGMRLLLFNPEGGFLNEPVRLVSLSATAFVMSMRGFHLSACARSELNGRTDTVGVSHLVCHLRTTY